MNQVLDMLWCPCEFPAGDDDYCEFHQHEPANCDCYDGEASDHGWDST